MNKKNTIIMVWVGGRVLGFFSSGLFGKEVKRVTPFFSGKAPVIRQKLLG